MWNLKIELENHQRAVDNARRVSADVTAFCAEQRRLARTPTLVGVAPQAAPASGTRAWAPLVAAGMAPRPNGRRTGVER